jgi:hypothetical protein
MSKPQTMRRGQPKSTKREGDLVANHSVRLRVERDPPTLAEQTRQLRRIRIGFLANTGYSPTPATIATFLPNGGAGWIAFRITRIDLWATDDRVGATAGTSSFGVALSLPGIVSTGVSSSFVVGDDAIFQDVGTTGQSRAQVHVIPAREFVQKWWSTTDTNSVPLTASSLPLAPAMSTALNILDLVVEMISKP